MKQTDYGIFIHRIPYSESSLIVTFYTFQGGIRKFIFQGAKKKNAVLFPLNICELDFYHRQDSELGKLTNASSVYPLDGIFGHPVRATVAFFIADVLRQTLQTNQHESELYRFLEHEIRRLNAGDQLTLFPLHFLVTYTHHIGIAPQMEDNPRYFSLQEGEFHNDTRPGELMVDGDVCTALYALFSGREPENAIRKAALKTLLDYYRMHVPGFNVSQSLEIVSTILND